MRPWFPQNVVQPTAPLTGGMNPAGVRIARTPNAFPQITPSPRTNPLWRLPGIAFNPNPPNPTPAGTYTETPAAQPATRADARVRTNGTYITEATDRGLPFGPGAGLRLGPILFGGYRDLIG